MRAYDIILKKRNGGVLSQEEIKYLIDGYVRGTVPEYQMAAWAMAVYFKGLNKEETAALTAEMISSGEIVDLSPIQGVKVDKHSTGGVGDKTTLVLVPLVASCGINVAKMSGRALGHTGGTLDKLESIPGFRVNLSKDEFIDTVKETGCAVVGQTGNLVPADKKLYSLRDVTATVDIIPLIASSVMSKKIAAGADKIVLDVKAGSGAFMKTTDQAMELAQVMVDIGKLLHKETIALITSMDQPLGFAVGNALEVKEAIQTLKGKGPKDLTELCLELGSRMLLLSGKYNSINEAKEKLKYVLTEGMALEKFREMIQAQGGDIRIIHQEELLPRACVQLPVIPNIEGVVTSIDTEQIGRIAMKLGAGREKKDDRIDYGVGIVLRKKITDSVSDGEEIAIVHANSIEKAEVAAEEVKNAFTISSTTDIDYRLILGEIDSDGKRRLFT